MAKKKKTKSILKDFLTPKEAALFLNAAKRTHRYGLRNYTLLFLIYRHGLRVSEAIDLRLSDLDLKSHRLQVRRLKNGLSTNHPLQSDEIKVLRTYLKAHPDLDDHLFVSERGPMTRFAVTVICSLVSKLAGLPPVNPHMLRHSCGYFLANKGHDTRLIQDYMGHKNIQSTVTYTKVCEQRFKELWRR